MRWSRRSRSDGGDGGTFECARCGGRHPGPPRSYFVAEPEVRADTRDPTTRRWGELFDEQAILHGVDGEEAWFVRGNIEIPVEDGGSLTYTVWVSLSRENFERLHDLWASPERLEEPAHFGWLSVALPGYPSTVNPKTNLHQRPPGERPFVELEPTDHPLAVEQREGISTARLVQLAELAAHGSE